MIIFHLSIKWWKVKFFILCDVIFLLRLQKKFEIDHSWEWMGWMIYKAQTDLPRCWPLLVLPFRELKVPKQINLSPFKRASHMSKMITLTHPFNPFNKIEWREETLWNTPWNNVFQKTKITFRWLMNFLVIEWMLPFFHQFYHLLYFVYK